MEPTWTYISNKNINTTAILGPEGHGAIVSGPRRQLSRAEPFFSNMAPRTRFSNTPAYIAMIRINFPSPASDEVTMFQNSTLLDKNIAGESGHSDTPDTPRAWSREIVAGDTLDALLAEADISANQRYATTSAIAAEFNLARLRPGNEVKVTRDADGNLTNVDIWIDRHNSIKTTIGKDIDVNIVKPDASRYPFAKEITVKGSIFTSLHKEGVPTQFASEIASTLSGHVNFRRDLQVGDTLEVLWSEKRTDEGDRIGGSDISYARLNTRSRTYDVVWEEGDSRLVFQNGDVIRTFSSPIPGARTSSKFGMRRHPVLGGRRMHEGNDFAAASGTPVLASTAGEVSYVGRRGAYGRVVEIKHSSSVKTRYAHLSKYDVKRGQSVEAGDRIGTVGSSGRVNGPHLHYEFLLNESAVDPMASGRWDSLEANGNDREKLNRLDAARKEYEQKLSEGSDGSPSKNTNLDDA
jgi:murein DD-endopeptidase MepM/ murein hydrolase activator NlpD